MTDNLVVDVIDSDLIQINLEAQNKDQVFQKVAQLFYKNGYISDVDEFVDAVYEREDEGVTGIGNHVAIPHGKSKTVKENGVAIVTLKEEVPWESLDETGAKVVILFAVSDDDNGANEHLKMLSLFAKKLGKDSVIESLLAAKNIDDVINAFNE